jgi:pSer/pThr/pTyr-binding forkhead associated (FHA) protein
MSQEDADRPGQTSRLNSEQRFTLAIPGLGAFDMRLASREIPYYAVPSHYKTLQDVIPWRILVKFGEPAPRLTIGLDIYADIVLGRGAGGPDSPDIDLTNLDALDLGVSRRHAMIRPTQNRMYLIDLSSTNGSFVNAVPVGRGMAQVLRHGDAISLARLSFIIEITSSPAIFQGRQPGEVTPSKPLREEATDIFMTPPRRQDTIPEPQPSQGRVVRLAPPSAPSGPATRRIPEELLPPAETGRDQGTPQKRSEEEG